MIYAMDYSRTGAVETENRRNSVKGNPKMLFGGRCSVETRTWTRAETHSLRLPSNITEYLAGDLLSGAKIRPAIPCTSGLLLLCERFNLYCVGVVENLRVIGEEAEPSHVLTSFVNLNPGKPL